MKKPSKLITLLLALLLIYGAVSFFTGGNDAILDTAADIAASAVESAAPAPDEKAPAGTDSDTGGNLEIRQLRHE